nr:ROK family transcriptional regulator [Propionibacterium sp.]
MRASNMGLLLRHLRSQGGRSRAQLASETGLSKATISSLIAALAERGLVREGEPVRDGAVGRPGLTVTLDGTYVAGVGLQINVDYVALTAVTLTGTVVRESVLPVDVAHLGADIVLDRVATMLRRTLASLRESRTDVVGITVSPPGVIDYAAGALRFAPNLGWRNVPLTEALSRRLGADAPPVHLENDAKLAAVAEYDRMARDGIRDLLYLTGDVGVGAGIIAEGRLVRGWSGFSGEVGHLPLDPGLTPCNCGRRGCWETVVGLAAFLRSAVPEGDSLRDPARPIADRLLTLRARADAGDERTLAALAAIAERLATGLGILVDVLNPRMIVLGGYYGYFREYLLPALEAKLEARLIDEGCRTLLATSELGLTASALGGALLSLEHVFDDPTVVAGR